MTDETYPVNLESLRYFFRWALHDNPLSIILFPTGNIGITCRKVDIIERFEFLPNGDVRETQRPVTRRQTAEPEHPS